MSPEREPMENDSNSRTAEELEQQTVDVYVERALHGPVFRMSYEHTHTYAPQPAISPAHSTAAVASAAIFLNILFPPSILYRVLRRVTYQSDQTAQTRP